MGMQREGSEKALFISLEEIKGRQEVSRKIARDLGMDALIVIGGPFYDRPGNLAYLTGHYPPFPSVDFQNEYRGLGFGVFILPISGKTVLVADTEAYRKERIAVDEIRSTRNLPTTVRSVLADLKLNTSRLGFVGLQVAPWALVNEIMENRGTIESADSILRKLRRCKSPVEIALLRKAAEVAEIGIRAALSAIKPGITEAEVCAEGIKAGITAGADFIRYLRVLSGPFSGWPHRWPPATERVLQEGETVCMDYIGAVHGYQFDILRSSIVGEGDMETRRLIQLASEATEAAIKACKPNVSVREVVRTADAIIDQAGFLQYRAKFTGHGIGLDTVELPFLMADSEDVLQPGDVLCLEPGILIRDKKGARFEYEVVITHDGFELLP